MSVLGVLQPESGNLPLFLHVLGAVVLFGATATVAVAAFAGRRRPDHGPLLSRIAFWTFLLGILPSWILMRVAAEWILDKEFPKESPGWVDVGFIVSEGGGLFLLVVGILAGLWPRRRSSTGLPLAVGLLASVVLVALGVASFAMSGKPDW